MKKDRVVRGTAKQCRFIGCELTESLKQITTTQGLSPIASSALGRLCIACVMMAEDIKGEKNSSITTKLAGDGELGTLMAVAKAGGDFKAYVQNPQVAIHLQNPSDSDIAKAIGRGELTIIKERSNGQPYSSITPIVYGNLAKDLAIYYYQSMQIPTIVAIDVLLDSSHQIRKAGGFIVEVLPDADEKRIGELENKMDQFPNLTDLMDMGYSIEKILQKFVLDKPNFLKSKSVRFFCDCRAERFLAGVRLLGKDEVDEILKDRGFVETICHFCGKTYRFTREELRDF